MENNSLKNRWYDKNIKMGEVLELMETLSGNDQRQLAFSLMEFINLLKRNNTETDSSVSIGKERVLGLYKALNRRRWYDNDTSLMSAMNTFSTLSEDDCKKITEGILLTLKD